ncbi:MAG TPA: SRPBCC domain-containing protein [Tepidisphaeraceae bacterium]|nr:SRPBCC domain-containing protein [Tepidisphaeraceae bacterium]
MNEPIRAVDIEMEIPINASKAEVWDALVHDISLWWPKQAFMTKATKFTLEPRVGGRAFEDSGDGTGGLWWNVHAIVTGEYLVLTGQIWPGNGGPATSIAKLSLETRGEQTILKIHDSMFGRLTDERVATVKWGWDHLLAKSLKPYAETERPDRK